MKIIFLDVDGVLINRESLLKASGIESHAHPMCVGVLNEIIRRTGAVLVMSSTWRTMMPIEKMRELLVAWGVKGELIDYTPELVTTKHGIQVSADRKTEICTWLLKTSIPITRWIAIDDEQAVDPCALVKTTFKLGLELSHIETAVKLLTA